MRSPRPAARIMAVVAGGSIGGEVGAEVGAEVGGEVCTLVSLGQAPGALRGRGPAVPTTPLPVN
jgi:hypothetical protein